MLPRSFIYSPVHDIYIEHHLKNNIKNLLPAISMIAYGDGDLITLEGIGSLPPSKYDDDAFDELKAGAFLPRLQLMTSSSKQVKEGEFPANHWALVQDQDYKDLGKNVDVLVCAWRPKAMDLGDTIIASYDRKSETFKQIQARSKEKDSGCMWGFEFLIWVAQTQSFATCFYGSKTARREAPNVKARLRKPATLSSKKIDNGSYTWFGPTSSDCSTPFGLPTTAAFSEEVEKFENPKEEGPELATEEDGNSRAQ